MTKIGPGHYLSVARTLQKQTRAVYADVLGASAKTLREDFDIFTFADHSQIGIFYVDPNLALTPAQHMSAMWLEFRVDNEAAIGARLRKLGLRPFDHFNVEPWYFQAPGRSLASPATLCREISPLVRLEAHPKRKNETAPRSSGHREARSGCLLRANSGQQYSNRKTACPFR